MAKPPSIREIASSLRSSIESLNSRIVEKSVERTKILNAPRPLSEVIRDIYSEIDRRADKHADFLLNRFSAAKSPKASSLEKTLSVHGSAGLDIDAGAFYWLHRDEIKTRLAETLANDPLVSGAETGLSDSERSEKLMAIDDEISKLEAEKQSLIDELSAAGLQIFL